MACLSTQYRIVHGQPLQHARFGQCGVVESRKRSCDHRCQDQGWIFKCNHDTTVQWHRDTLSARSGFHPPCATTSGNACQWGDGGGDEPDTDVECIDGSDIIPPTGIDRSGVCDNGRRSEQHCDDFLRSEWIGWVHTVLLACKCIE